MDPILRQHRRAKRGESLLITQRHAHFETDSDGSDEDTLTDVLTDLMHYCDELGPAGEDMFNKALEDARAQYQAETSSQGGIQRPTEVPTLSDR